jgi:DNA-binding SARP family transcriptional activator
VARLRLHTFGGLQVLDEQGRALLLPARKPAALFAYLAMHPGRAQPRARLASMLWGSSDEAAARASLRQALLVVRRALQLDDELVAAPGETLLLAPGVAAVDALELEAAVGARGDDDDTFDAPRVAALVGTIDGEFLEGLDTREAGFDDWLALRRSELRERLAAAHTRLLDAYRQQAMPDAAIASALRLLALDPLREEMHRTLMELYAGQRRWGAALRQFGLCRDVLARELGVRPQPATLRLRDQIEQQRVQGDTVAQAPAGMQAAGGAELRHVVLLAADASPAADDADPELAPARADALARGAHEVVERFGGTLERRPGGGMLACFGAPVGHGDDIERAARCALRLVEEQPGLRVGLAAGLVLVAGATAQRAASVGGGEVAGLASRLLGGAAAGEVLVAEPLWRRLSPFVDGRRCAGAGLPASLRQAGVHRLTGLRPPAARRAALVGRQAEIALFGTLLDACLRGTGGAMLHLRGEPGIGKTRLAEEFRALAVARGFAAHVGAVLDFGSGAERDAIRALVLDLLGLGAARIDEQAVGAAIAAALASGLAAPEDEAALHALARQAPPARLRANVDGMDHASRLRAQRDALARLAGRCAARMPQLLVLEDLHWADAATLDHAAALAGVTAAAPLLLVTTARSDGDPLDAAWHQASGASAVSTLDIGPLRRVDASTLAAQLADASDPFALGCVERAGGNPLFLEQLLQAERVPSSALPATVQSVVQARLDRLGAPEREALRVASVLGQRFALAALDHLLGEPAAWDPRLARGLLRADAGEGQFAHALVRDGAYASLPRARRRELHAKAARWYAGRDAVLRAEQLEGAEDPAAAQGWLDAARAEALAHRHERAREFAARGLALAADTAVRFALAACEAEALENLGRTAQAHAAWQRALDVAGDDADRCRAWIGIASALRLRDDLDGAAAALDRAEALAAHAPAAAADEMRARVHLLRGNLLFPRGDLDGCRREHDAALALARRVGSIELEAAALGGLGDAEYLRGRMLTAERQFSACVALAAAHGLRRVEAANLPMAAWTRWFAGDLAGALAATDLGIDRARAIGHLRAQAIGHHAGCQMRQSLGEFALAREHAEQALDLARQLQSPRFEAEALAFLGDLDAATGDAERAVARLQDAIALARASGMAYMGPIFLGILARVAAPDAAVRQPALDEAEALLATNGLAHNHLLFRRQAIDACLAIGDAAAMRRHAQLLERRTADEPLPWSAFVIRRAQTLADALEGRAGGGRALHVAAVADEGERLGLRVDAAALRTRGGGDMHFAGEA